MRWRRVDAVVAAVVVLVVGFALAAVFPERSWIEAATWLGALAIAVAATIRRWLRTDEKELVPEGEEPVGTEVPRSEDPSLRAPEDTPLRDP